MAVFYVLPSRVEVGRHFQEYLGAVFPGLSWLRGEWPDLAEALAQAAEGQSGAFVVFAEDLDDSLGIEGSLIRDFGGETSDEVVIVSPSRNIAMVQAERRRLGEIRRAA